MKLNLFFLFCIGLACISCQKNEGDITLIIEQTQHEVNYEGDVVQIEIQSNSNWTVKNDGEWCIPDKTTGNGNGTVSFTIGKNEEPQTRKSRVVVTCKNNISSVSQAILITQKSEIEELYYELPVIFHVLYNNPSDDRQNIKGDRLTEILDQCNKFYKNELFESINESQDMNLKFVLATQTPDGQTLEEPGIERIQWSKTINISCDEFMESKSTEYIDLLWDPNKYINIFIYAFTEESVAGISHLPYTLPTNALEGLVDGSYYIDNQPDYPHCISINNEFVYAHNKDLNREELEITLSHELGHYLGLFHAFSSKACNESDYCDDTPNYNRTEYESWLERMANRITFKDAVVRTGCDSQSFTSYNMMDYWYSYLDRFTPNQRARVRHVLVNSPLIPGPKNKANRAKLTKSNEIPPIRTIK